MRNRKNNQQSSERRKEKNNSDAPRKYGRKNLISLAKIHLNLSGKDIF